MESFIFWAAVQVKRAESEELTSNIYIFYVTCVQEALTRNVVDHHGHSGVPYITGDEAPEALLSCCVPELQPHLGFRETTLRRGRRFRQSESQRTMGSLQTHTHTGADNTHMHKFTAGFIYTRAFISKVVLFS